MAMTTMMSVASALAEGKVTPVQLLTAALDAAAEAKSVFVSMLAERAGIEADASAARWREGTQLSPFDGVPYVVKDLFDVAGSVTTAGSRTRAQTVPASRDAAIVTALAKSGLVLLGKTSLSEFAFSGLGLNPHFGTPTPGYDPSRVPGGSSSGTAIAIERGIVAIGLGTDTAGSMRVPAAFNGLVGLRPSQGRYDPAGIFPLAATFDVPGPMARGVTDIAALDGMMRGVPPVVLGEAPHFILDTTMLGDVVVTPQIRADILSAVEGIRSRGADVELRQLRTTGEARRLIGTSGWLGGYEAAALHAQLLDGPERALVDARVVRRLDAARAMTDETARQLRRCRAELINAHRAEVGQAIVLSPTVGHPAPPLAPLEADPDLFATTNLNTLALTMVASFLDLPALAMPTGGVARASMQLSAANGRDDAVIAAGLYLESLALEFI